MKKNSICWIVEGCSVGDTILVFEDSQTSRITVTGFYDRYLLGKTEKGSPKSVNYASLYSDKGGAYAINARTLTPVHVTPDHPARHIRCREKRPVKGRNPGNTQASGSSSGSRHENSGSLSA